MDCSWGELGEYDTAEGEQEEIRLHRNFRTFSSIPGILNKSSRELIQSSRDFSAFIKWCICVTSVK